MSEVADHVDLHVGEHITVELPGLGTAGFIWQEHVVGPPDVIRVSWSRGFAPGAEPSAVGVSAPERATIQAVGPGEVTLRLVQVQPWEPQAKPHSERQTSVRVIR